jgi:hypothetical protein
MLICPTTDFPKSQFPKLQSSPGLQNISLYQNLKSGVWFVQSRAWTEGRIAIVTKRGAGCDGRFGIN